MGEEEEVEEVEEGAEQNFSVMEHLGRELERDNGVVREGDPTLPIPGEIRATQQHSPMLRWRQPP